MRLKDRLRVFMAQHNLTHKEMAAKLDTPYFTFAKWMRAKRDNQPPGCMLALMTILESSSEARKIIGIKP